MLAIPGFSVQSQIYESANSRVYRAIRESDRQPVILKILKEDYPTPVEIARYRTEYQITKSLNLPGVVKVYDLQKYQNTLLMSVEDFGGESLKILMQQRSFKFEEFLSIAIQTTETLALLHAAHIIHKDINPSNIVLNPATGQLKIIDFGISTQVTRENTVLKNPNVLEGTLAYMSPEQTGRMNRALDYRTDFYSLGVTFYKLLTNKLPFETTDPLELVHCHIAKQPLPPCEVNPEIPKAVSDIVMKLMAKTAEERYQSALGIKADLEECLNQLYGAGSISDFPLAHQDISDRFQLSQKLYGREREIDALLEAFDRIASPSETRATSEKSSLMLIAGYSGIGKSALVQELYKPITEKRGYFIAGKFDQFQRNIPYSAVVSAFRELVKQLLTETEVQLQEWRKKLQDALGINGQVIVEVIPEVELIIGNQPDIPEVGTNESQNRFNFVFQNFIKVFAQPERPLALFLDDLQWADGASLKLMQVLISDSAPGLFLIGAYRDNEVSSAHPLMLALEEIVKAGATVNRIYLSPLELPAVTKLVSDTLDCSEDRAQPLADLVLVKTGGNPFFMNEFLKSLYTERLLEFDWETSKWQWSLEEIQGRDFTDNVVELMADKIQKLPEAAQEMLKLSACIGNKFDLKTLSAIGEKSLRETAIALQAAAVEGLVVPLGSMGDVELAIAQTEFPSCPLPAADSQSLEYKFVHDRVQQAAYSLIPDADKKATHLKIGQLLLKNIEPSHREEKIFEIVNQLNVGWELLENPSQRDELARMNLLAGCKAKASTAYAAAAKCLAVALALLPPDSWQRQYDFTLELYTAAAEAEYLNINFARSVELSEVAMRNAATLRDRVKVHELQMQINIAQLEMGKAVEIGLQVLDSLGISLVSLAGDENLIVDMPALADLDHLPLMTDADKLAAMQILKLLCTPVFQAKPEIFPQLILTMIHLYLQWGYSALSAFAYGFYGLLLVGFGKLDAGYKAGLIALKLLEKFNANKLKATVFNLFNSNNRTWKEHAKNSIAPLQEGVQSGLETGELEWAGYCAGNLSGYLFLTGNNLAATVQAQSIYIDLCQRIRQEIPTYFSQVWLQLALNFQGQAADILVLTGAGFDERQILPRLIARKAGTILFVFYVAKVILAYSFNASDRALENVQKANEYAGTAFGFVQVSFLNFYHSLALLDRYPSVSPSEQETYWQQVETNQAQLKFWAEHAPANNQHKYDLVAAEQARLQEKNWEASELYDRAIALAKEHEYIQEEALACELAAKFYLSRGKTLIARAYLQEARYGYQLWGAIAKVKDLEARYPQLLMATQPSDKNPKTTAFVTTTGSNNNLDITTVMKASQAISGEIVLDKLLSSLMKILIENAGAQRGYLILYRQGKLLIEAEGAIEGDRVTVLQSVPVENCQTLSEVIVNYVARTQESVVLNDATREEKFTSDRYIQKHQPKSLLCVPLINQGQLVSIVYLENNLTTGAFTAERIEILKLLSSQAAISIANAQLYAEVRESESRLVQFLEAMPVGVGILDASGQPYYTNRIAQELLGKGIVPDVTSEQIAEVYQVYKAGTNQEYPSADLPVVRAFRGESTTADDMEINQGDKIIPIEAWGTPIYDENGKISYAIVAFQDITERRKAEAERQRVTNELFQLNQAYERFVPRQFLQLLQKSSIVDVGLGEQVQLEMSVLFSDIRDFTTLSEKMTPAENFKFINSYLSRMEPAITENHGFIDKYIGDAIMALFSGEADNAVKAGIAMLHRLHEYNQERANSGCAPIQIGIGINTGFLMLGTVGGQNRMDGTVISDAVNLASRVEGLTKNYGVALLITEQTYSRLTNSSDFAVRSIDTVTVKGKSQAVTVYEIFEADLPEIKAGKLATLPIFTEARSLYNSGKINEAGKLFKKCLRSNPGDTVSEIYLQRCQQYWQSR